MRIEDVTQTKDGTPVRIYATDGCGWYPIHGAIWDYEDNGYKPFWWTKTGCSLLGAGTEHLTDLDLHDWRDDIPWECLKEEIQWVAKMPIGEKEWYGFATKPELVEKEKGSFCFWQSKLIDAFRLEGVKMPEGPNNVKDSLTKRPEGR